MKIIVRSENLVTTLIDRGLTVSAAAKLAGIGRALVAELIRSDRKISVKTAGKLKATFGADVVDIVEE